VDAWDVLHPGQEGLSCCFSSDLTEGALGTRIDLTLAGGAVSPAMSVELGLTDRTASGLHPSDHAGFSTTFRLENPRFFGLAKR
jgi:hypothetical protein